MCIFGPKMSKNRPILQTIKYKNSAKSWISEVTDDDMNNSHFST